MPTVWLFSNHFPITMENSLFWNLNERHIAIPLSLSFSLYCIQRIQGNDRKSLFILAKLSKNDIVSVLTHIRLFG